MHFTASPCIVAEPAAPRSKTVAESEESKRQLFKHPNNPPLSVATQLNIT